MKQNPVYILEVDEASPQRDQFLSFIGGKPKLPEEMAMPSCELCCEELTFFFQVAFPENHTWRGLSLAVFTCTLCANEDYVIPSMVSGHLLGANIPQTFLQEYQVNFRLLVFDTNKGKLRSDYEEKIRFKQWKLNQTSTPNVKANKIGGAPSWILEDETPATYDTNTSMFFLMQIQEGFEFELVEGAPPQKELYDDFPGYKPSPFYKLWLGNFAYFFGTADRNLPFVYVISQVD
jgi:hypothetical protein